LRQIITELIDKNDLKKRIWNVCVFVGNCRKTTFSPASKKVIYFAESLIFFLPQEKIYEKGHFKVTILSNMCARLREIKLLTSLSGMAQCTNERTGG